MKKILLVALAAVAMASCSENEEFENVSTTNQIKFGTVVKAGTKAEVITAGNLKTFTVNAYKTTAGMGTDVQLSTGFMDNVEVTKSPSEWQYTGNYYWPSSGKLQFFATSPAQTLDITTAGYPKFEYTVKAVTGQEDLVAANVINQIKSESAITLPFQHLLTQVNFSIKGSTPDFTYTVSKLVIKGAKDKATFTFDGSATVGAWSSLVESVSGVTYEYAGTVTVTPTTADPNASASFETAGNALFMLMPQDNLTGVTVDVTYTAAPKNGEKLGEPTFDGTKTVNLTGSWGMGKNIRYTLTLTSDATSIKFIPETGKWTDENGTFTGL